MPNPAQDIDLVIKKLDAIHSVLLDILIIEGERAGLSKAEVREIAEVADGRVTKTWKRLKAKKTE